MHIHFEGLDLAGKTTLCRRFRQHEGGDWEVHHNSLDPGNPVWQLADRIRKEDSYSEETIGWCYHAAMMADFEGYRPPDGNRLQDSTVLLRSLAYHTVAGTPGLPGALKALLDRHPRFDRSFVCVASVEARLRRLSIRRKENLSAEDFIVRDDLKRFSDMEEVIIDLAQRHFDAVIIDTSNLEEEEGRAPGDGGPPIALDRVLAALPDSPTW